MKLYTLLLLLILTVIFSSCSIITREETDTYTVTERDTTFKHFIKNAPGNEDRGVVHPSTREILKERNLLQWDSTVTRDYPNFIRAGLFEGVGLIGGNTSYSLNTGIFGIYPEPELLDEHSRGTENGSIFAGGMYRFGIYENRLRWFRDAPGWSWGFHLFEAIIPEARIENSLLSYATPYIRKRFYLSEEIPYQAATISVGLGHTPSQYINLSGSYDVGSIGGLNIRGYLGFAFGYNSASTTMIKNNDFVDEGQFNTIPYAGIGVSVLDFINVVPELYTEWKYHEHSSWQVGLIKYMSFNTISVTSNIPEPEKNDNEFIDGGDIKIANASVALPVLDHKLYAGTSLFRLFLSERAAAIGVLPIRVGLWQQLIKDELSFDPFIEYGYYPSSYFDIGANLSLHISNSLSISIVLGYIDGKTTGGLNTEVLDILGDVDSFNSVYIGMSLNLFDRIFFPEQLRYNRDDI